MQIHTRPRIARRLFKDFAIGIAIVGALFAVLASDARAGWVDEVTFDKAIAPSVPSAGLGASLALEPTADRARQDARSVQHEVSHAAYEANAALYGRRLDGLVRPVRRSQRVESRAAALFTISAVFAVMCAVTLFFWRVLAGGNSATPSTNGPRPVQTVLNSVCGQIMSC